MIEFELDRVQLLKQKMDYYKSKFQDYSKQMTELAENGYWALSIRYDECRHDMFLIMYSFMNGYDYNRTINELGNGVNELKVRWDCVSSNAIVQKDGLFPWAGNLAKISENVSEKKKLLKEVEKKIQWAIALERKEVEVDLHFTEIVDLIDILGPGIVLSKAVGDKVILEIQ